MGTMTFIFGYTVRTHGFIGHTGAHAGPFNQDSRKASLRPCAYRIRFSMCPCERWQFFAPNIHFQTTISNCYINPDQDVCTLL